MLIQDYTYNWIKDFNTIKTIIQEEFLELKISIEHIGSTAVPQLAAKPIIDIDIVFYPPTTFHEVKIRLEQMGYLHHGNQGILNREVFKPSWSLHSVLKTIVHHLYVCPADSDELRRHILFRDYLIRDEEARLKYQKLKYDIAQAAHQNKKKYAALKEIMAKDFIETIIRLCDV